MQQTSCVCLSILSSAPSPIAPLIRRVNQVGGVRVAHKPYGVAAQDTNNDDAFRCEFVAARMSHTSSIDFLRNSVESCGGREWTHVLSQKLATNYLTAKPSLASGSRAMKTRSPVCRIEAVIMMPCGAQLTAEMWVPENTSVGLAPLRHQQQQTVTPAHRSKVNHGKERFN